ncbi:Leader peptidase (Prepilin peptidase) / N-methyltransferase [Halanaerobium saccharolyticum subsp. saccharolyticum DSM 6643]|uniref:Prepilin leader peptidase/N-methyltransferase n=1 Tax=Halanaerobium saccharolyticum subsp. saccharolyticum DSM 6643 TaxID=1293054 RepID=M5E1D2_9FIRM|nr:A24 family peptidase [Halanaerobium saccharolyticum]CCU79390.1 Leader peptidase (Prepilin peptidase) / N-methyltransferase [Halanaerobium saccharolyticum subsp. saccharolyticum DSM 6643]
MIFFLYFLILGLLIGSFLNVIIYRLPEEKSIITPPSHCPKCGTRLKVIDLIPVLSFLSTRGKCRYCNTKISIQYPLVELLTGFLFLAAYLKFGISIQLFIYLLLISALIAVTVIDYKYMIIPNKITYPLIVISVLSAIIFDYLTIFQSLLGIVIPSLLLLIVAFIFKGGMGMGDVKLVAAIGGFMGWSYTLAGIFLGSLLGSIIGLSLMGLGIIGRKTRIPFGPFICIGAVVMIFFGDTLFNWYINLFL